MNRNKRKAEQKKGSRRRISCKDLGNGDCEGWMWHQKERTGLVPKSWKKYWFKLKDRNLYCYKDPHDVVAQRMFQMPAFLVALTTDASKTFTFKISNSSFGTVFFRTKDGVDLSKWVTKLQLSTLPEKEAVQVDLVDVSESENEDEAEEDNKMLLCGAKYVEEKLQFGFPSAEAGSIDPSSVDKELSSEIHLSSIESIPTCTATLEPAASTIYMTAKMPTTTPETAATVTVLKLSRDSIFPPSKPLICTKRMSGTEPDLTSNINSVPSPSPNISENLPFRPATLPKSKNSSSPGNPTKKPVTLPKSKNSSTGSLGTLMKKPPATLPKKKGSSLDPQSNVFHPSTPRSSESTASERTSIGLSVTNLSPVLSAVTQEQYTSASSFDTDVTFPAESVTPSVGTKRGPPTFKTPSPKRDLCSDSPFAARSSDLDISNHLTTVQVLTLPSPAIFPTVNSECDKKGESFLKEEAPCCEKFETLNAKDQYRDLCTRLNGLRHSLKIKVQELQTINELLSLPFIKSEALNQFCREHKDIVFQLSGENSSLTDIL